MKIVNSLNTIGTGLLVSSGVFLNTGDKWSAVIAGILGIAALLVYDFFPEKPL